MKKDFLQVLLIFKAQFIKAVAFVAFALNRHARFMFGKGIGRFGGTVVGSACDYRPVRVAV
ncbi:hypothetical protein HMPREF9996_01335 [Aggregatibacter actinomycetemcomitans Y4]|uniref:Uncharacterized protein n=1 Tax=Aggregatibacter actinomycetemcomitans TaxID=714 RepID=A0AB74N125_AGGAC|nr:hypothetical protein HMPREF9996_01335 [Aggregatibacter actinomycetemcomitans Y4]TYA37963.1 hypothetical protein FXB79_11380 [Aggregatibacter actinomycetemcomitans]TYA44124.1 hypothetical protein FV644_11470 [Aggregatibacter actinomycetemcomitans]TYB05445.1 hypothetical protein FXE07_11425 [Aggregatibacter actinomycetemcomitans]